MAVSFTVYVPAVAYVIFTVAFVLPWPLPKFQIKAVGVPVQFWVKVTVWGLQYSPFDVEKLKSTVWAFVPEWLQIKSSSMINRVNMCTNNG